MAGDAVPTAVVRLDSADPLAATDAEWFRLATAHGLFDEEDGGFLVTLGDGGWFRVRLGQEWRLAEVLRSQPRCPEFLTLSSDGRTLLGVTTEEYEIWLIVIDDLPAHQERRARRLARAESDEERAAAWEGLFGRLRVLPATRERWATGLLSNPALPDDLRVDLMVRTRRFHGRPLPAESIDALLAHPDCPQAGLLRYAGDSDPRMRRLALDDPDSTPELVERFTLDPHHEVRLRAAVDPRLSRLGAVRLLDDPEAAVRAAAARCSRLPAHVLVTLLRDRGTAEDAARNTAIPLGVIRQMAERDRSGAGRGPG
ncbi:hypothetical protein [Streptomyces sp. NPDC050145]|uniref:hypothetical protein n=1 Tax=Streptomyces sp. NPDC050145 TaxID=3365602 RepID=UPI0037AEEF34